MVDEEDDVNEEGPRTLLKDIPNGMVHAVDFKNNLQFSDLHGMKARKKQRVKIKAKLDKYHKDALLDLANLFNLTVSKANIKKEEIIVQLLDFMEAPYATTDTMTAEKEQSAKSRKRKRDAKASTSKRSRGTSTENLGRCVVWRNLLRMRTWQSRMKMFLKDMEIEDDEEQNDTENGIPVEDGAPGQSERDLKET
ncbi:hypothetical protein HPP92_013590 [Vanilla planifolia]|uniref:Uncharacterized protein n=1 Tax=Vanilla planifolia TaxID=51239 RepID=A0A835V0R8_VANPL|nr:hypothetical protein HPP92_013590 [Vanilla planifolia]